MLTKLKVLKDTQGLRRTHIRGEPHTFLGVYAHVCKDSQRQVSALAFFQTYAKVLGFVDGAGNEVYGPLQGAIKGAL